MPVKPFAKLLVGATVALAAVTSAASATPMLSLGITGLGTYTVDTGDITANTATKTIPDNSGPSDEIVTSASVSPGISLNNDLGITLFSTHVIFENASGAPDYTLITAVPPNNGNAVLLKLAVGDLVFSFNDLVESKLMRVASGPNSAGTISEQFDGTVIVDPSGIFLNQSVSLSETCTQSSTGAVITCSESTISPASPTPEPASMALLGAGLFGLSMARRRRS